MVSTNAERGIMSERMVKEKELIYYKQIGTVKLGI